MGKHSLKNIVVIGDVLRKVVNEGKKIIFGWGFVPRLIKFGYPTYCQIFLCKYRREMGVGALESWET